TPRRAALLLYGICGIAAILSLIQNAFHNQLGGLIVILFCAGAWIGIQHLDYSEFGLATRLLRKGGFRRTVDVQFRLQEFERSLTAASTLDQCWEVIQGGCRDFGFAGVRLNLLGRVMEAGQRPQAGTQCQIRITFPDSQYVNLYCDFQDDRGAAKIAGFAGALERSLQRQIPTLKVEWLANDRGGRSTTILQARESERLAATRRPCRGKAL